MRIEKIREALGATLVGGARSLLDDTVDYIYASDLMSDVLAFGKANSFLITGLAAKQSVITAHMAEFKGVVFIRGKSPDIGSIKYAEDHQLLLLSTKYDMFEACVLINKAFGDNEKIKRIECCETKKDEISLRKEFYVEGKDFSEVGMISTNVKTILKKIGFDPLIVRRVAISTYEGELNVIMHAERGKVILVVSSSMIEVIIDDEGDGIPDVELAMQEGYTTATAEMRAMGFGSGMGLPNIKKNADDLEVISEVGVGTTLIMKFLFSES